MSVRAEEVSTSGRFGHDPNFWDNVDQLRASDDLINQLNHIFESNYHDPTEGIGQFSLNYTSGAPDAMRGFFDRGGLSIRYDQIAGGEIYNRISPELRGYDVWTTSFEATLYSSPKPGESGLEFFLGSSAGFGEQSLIEGPITNFLQETPTQESMVYFYGLDAGLGGRRMVSPNLSFNYKVLISPTYFYSAFKDPAYEFRVGSGNLYTRWRTESEFAALWHGWCKGEVGVQGIAGPQPIPVQILPRVWDAVHHIEAFPAFGSAVGLGTFLRFYNGSKRFYLETLGGFYGGYVGGAVNLRIYWFELQGGSFGLEQTPGFQVRESRINYIAGSLNYVW